MQTAARFTDLVPQAPSRWIKFKDVHPIPATPAEIIIAQDLNWLVDQKSEFVPGWEKIAGTLASHFYAHRPFLKNPNNSKHGLLRLELIVKQLSQIGAANLDKIDLHLLSPETITSTINGRRRAPFQRYSLLAQLIGLNLRHLVTNAINPSELETRTAEMIRRRREKFASTLVLTVSKARRRVQKAISSNPLLIAADLRRLLPAEIQKLRRNDSDWCNRMVPKRGDSRVTSMRWAQLDKQYSQQLTDRCRSDLSLTLRQAIGDSNFLKNAGLSITLLSSANGRLPKTQLTVERLLTERRMLWIEMKKRSIDRAIHDHPDMTRGELRNRCRNDLRQVLRFDPKWVCSRIERQRRDRDFVAARWKRKDLTLVKRLKRVWVALCQHRGRNLGLATLCQLAKLPKYYLSFAGVNHLPRSHRLARALIQAKKRFDIYRLRRNLEAARQREPLLQQKEYDEAGYWIAEHGCAEDRTWYRHFRDQVIAARVLSRKGRGS